jgi:hypothetical protein
MNLLTNGFVNNCGRLFGPPEQVKLASALRSHAMAARIQQAQLPSKDFFHAGLEIDYHLIASLSGKR